MKKRIALLLVLALVMSVLAGCCLKHDWKNATCEDPKTCRKCDKTEGEALGHEWEDATCDKPQTCSVCGDTKGRALGHEWENATCEKAMTCSVCGEVSGEPLEHELAVFSIDGVNKLGDCELCGQSVSIPIDWSTFPSEILPGHWTAYALAIDDYTVDAPEGSYADIHEDGTIEFMLNGDFYTGTWSFSEQDDVEECMYFEIVFPNDETGDEYFIGLIYYTDPTDMVLVTFVDGSSLAIGIKK